MKDAAAISAQLVDMRNVGAHKSLKLTLHVPEEYALKAIEAFGWPTGASPVPVALARLVNPAEETSHKPPPSPHPDQAGAMRKPIGATRKKMPQRIGILCSDPVFQKFLCRMYNYGSCNEKEAADTVRHYCNVASRSEIIWGSAAGKKWEDLHSKFIAWRDEPDLADAAE